ncbi:PH domain-containing protein [Mesonia sp. HuA40]|uniref:PH domain-containing protein n=1 Tax=Mesonia sp. HuA40 TaxID=2602761 RepID=UPI0011CCAF91|nr:PH domain-containing protein [Mesonia sp. HuA40]TXK71118.1 PH domain-containing protein [Mesonia sp. HuA40]
MKDFVNNSIDLDDLPDFESVYLKGSVKTYFKKMVLQWAIFCLVYSLILLALVNLNWGIPIWVFKISSLFAFFLVLLGVFLSFKRYRSIGYALRQKDVIFQRGWLMKKTTVIPFNRIQHVASKQSFLDKKLGLAVLRIYTAGGSGSDISIVGLLPEEALKIKEFIIQLIDAEERTE